jgi:hypothetical protein
MSSDKGLWTCFQSHEEQCQGEILRVPLDKLASALGSRKYSALEEFVNRNSDGLGNPLPQEVYKNLGLAIACLNNRLADYPGGVLLAQKEARLKRRANKQRFRRAAIKQNVALTAPRLKPMHLSPYRNSTAHISRGALITQHWTGSWHFRELNEILGIMGLSQSDDFIRDRLRSLRAHNVPMFKLIESQAATLKTIRKTA